MHPKMLVEISSLRGCIWTMGTLKWTLTRVGQKMIIELGSPLGGIVALGTLEWTHVEMSEEMSSEIGLLFSFIIT